LAGLGTCSLAGGFTVDPSSGGSLVTTTGSCRRTHCGSCSTWPGHSLVPRRNGHRWGYCRECDFAHANTAERQRAGRARPGGRLEVRNRCFDVGRAMVGWCSETSLLGDLRAETPPRHLPECLRHVPLRAPSGPSKPNILSEVLLTWFPTSHTTSRCPSSSLPTPDLSLRFVGLATTSHVPEHYVSSVWPDRPTKPELRPLRLEHLGLDLVNRRSGELLVQSTHPTMFVAEASADVSSHIRSFGTLGVRTIALGRVRPSYTSPLWQTPSATCSGRRKPTIWTSPNWPLSSSRSTSVSTSTSKT